MSQSEISNALLPADRAGLTRPIEAGPIRCSAIARRTGERCRKFPIRGANVCRSHGGAAPQVRRAAHRRLAEAEAARLVAQEGSSPTRDPIEALLRVCGEMESLSTALRNRVANLSDITNTDRTGAQDTVAELQAYERSLDRLARTLVAINRLGLEERRIAIQQRKADLLRECVTRAVFSAQADLSYEQGHRVLQALATELRLLPIAAWED